MGEAERYISDEPQRRTCMENWLLLREFTRGRRGDEKMLQKSCMNGPDCYCGPVKKDLDSLPRQMQF